MMRRIGTRAMAMRAIVSDSKPTETVRRGVSLIEVMITMSATSLVFMVVISVIHQSFRVGSQQMRRTSDDATLDALSSRWRSDLAHVKAIAWPDDQTLEIVDQEDNIVTYTAELQTMIRNDDTGTQAFPMSAFYEFQWERGEIASALHVRRRPIEHMDSMEFRVWALVSPSSGGIVASPPTKGVGE